MKFIITSIFISIFLSCHENSREVELKSKGNGIVEKIEIYKHKKGRLPNSLSDLGIEEKVEGPIYYNMIDSSKYIVWFGTTVGESITYSSETKKWE